MSAGEDFLAAYAMPRLSRLAPNLFAACFSLMKLLPARYMLERAQASGRLQRGGPVAETTSGTFGLALAMVAAVHGLELILVSATSLLDEKLRRRLELLGTTVQPLRNEPHLSRQERRSGSLKRVNLHV